MGIGYLLKGDVDSAGGSGKMRSAGIYPHLQWFITEQVEEEKSAGEIVEHLKMVGDHSTALFMLDRQLGARGTDR